MSLTDLLPEVRPLSKADKLRLIQFLARELERDDDSVEGPSELIEEGLSYPVWSPDRAYSAASVMLQALEEDKNVP